MVALCECGCGGEAPIAAYTFRARGWVKGQAVRFIRGHSRRKAPVEYLVDEATGCWVWQRSRTKAGYGNRNIDGRYVLAHRYAYEQRHGPIPKEIDAHHRCRNRLCVNPDHIDLIEHAEHGRMHGGER